jgi:hypothetical protein
VVLSVDEKTQVQALGRTQPVLSIAFAATEKRTYDYVRHGTTNFFCRAELRHRRSTRRVYTEPERRNLPSATAVKSTDAPL